MDSRLLPYFERELGYLRELGAEFSREYPKVAGRLGLSNNEVTDPYVERLLEGFAFLTARIQLKMDAEFPRFSQQLLDVVYPHYLTPQPAMAIVRFGPGRREAGLHAGYRLPAGTALHASLAEGEQTACEFRTAHDVTMWPVRIAEVSLTPNIQDIPLSGVERGGHVRGALRVRLVVTGAASWRDLPIERLTFFFAGQQVHALQLMELVVAHRACAIVRAPGTSKHAVLAHDDIRHEGFDREQALLPYDVRSFQGYRLLHEYFVLPARYQFFSIGDLRPVLASIDGQTLEIIILLDRAPDALCNAVKIDSLELFCTPVVNLFPRRTDRVPVDSHHHEHHLVVDRSRPADHEIYQVTRVTGYRAQSGDEHVFQPFYETHQVRGSGSAHYFTTRREPRAVPAAPRGGARAGYAGSEVFVSLVDQDEAPFPTDLRYVCADTLCTNRHLPDLMAVAGKSDFNLHVSAPVETITMLRGPTPARTPIGGNEVTWRLISHLGLNYLSLTDLDGPRGAQALRELLGLYAGAADAAVARQVEGVRSVRVEPSCRQLGCPGPLTFVRGVVVSVQLDEAAFSGGSICLFGAVLGQFFARHVSINSFVELVVHTLQHAEVMRWPPRSGCRPVA